MKRLFWTGVGVAAAVVAARWWRQQRERYGAQNLAAKAGGGVRDFRELLRASIAEGKRAAREKEAELLRSIEEEPPATG